MVSDERRLRDLTTICEINLRISSEITVSALLDLIAFYATVLLEAERATILQIDEDTGQLQVASAYGDLPAGIEPGASFPGAIALELSTDAKVRYLLVSPEQRKAMPFLRDNSTDWAILASILGKRGPVGVLAVESKVTGEPFHDYDGDVLQLLVSQAGIAIENAKVYQSLDYLVDMRTKELEAERDRSDQLLLNILPREVVDELHTYGTVQPRRFESATVLFTDFCNFTNIAEKMSPEDLLSQLEEFYGRFDEISEHYGLERLKTIGDAYMCVAGVPTPNEAHAVNAVQAALDIAECVMQAQMVQREKNNPVWRVRIGVHSGPLVAGVVGKRRFAYDIWGDTVNVASRMQANGMPDRVNVSAASHDLIREHFLCEPRHLIEVKGKGPLQMYWVTARRAR